MSVHIRPYRAGDETQIVPLLELVFKGWPPFDLPCSPLDHWKWKYQSQPTFFNEIGVALDNDKIVGCNHAIYFKMFFGDREYQGRQGCDLAVHPDYRRKGIYTKINVLREELRSRNKAQIGYFSSSNPIVIKRRKRSRFPHKLSTLTRIKDIDLHFKHKPSNAMFLKKIGYLASKALNKIREQKTVSQSEITTKTINKFEAEVDEFFHIVKNKYFWITKKDQNYLNWRFCDPRAGEYHVKAAYDVNDVFQGYIVYKIDKKTDYAIGYIVDFLSLPGKDNVKKTLIDEALEFFDSMGVNTVISHAVQSSIDYKFLRSCGLVDARRENVMFCNSYDDSIESKEEFNQTDPNQIHFTISDMDWN